MLTVSENKNKRLFRQQVLNCQRHGARPNGLIMHIMSFGASQDLAIANGPSATPVPESLINLQSQQFNRRLAV